MASIYEAVLDSLLAGETVTLHCNGNGEQVHLNTVRPRLSALYAKFRRTMAAAGVAVAERKIVYTAKPDGSLVLHMQAARPSGFRISAVSADGTERELNAPCAERARAVDEVPAVCTKPKLELDLELGLGDEEL